MNANAYWKKRIESEIKANLKRDTELGDELKTLHERHLRNIEKEIDSFYNKYALNNKVDVVEAKRRADAFDVDGFKDKAKQYVKEKNFSTKANDELALYNLKMKVSRLELLQHNIDLELIALANAEEDLIDKVLVQTYLDELNLQAGILSEFIPNPKQLSRMSRAIIDTPFQGATWAQRIWQRQEALRVVVSSITKAAVLRGKNSMDFIPLLRKEFGVSAKHAKRLAVTETARVQTAVQKESYKENGFDEYEFMAEPSACPICAKLDGKKFKVSDMEPGQNAAPMHPHCHCSTAPYMDRAELDKMLDEWERMKKGRGSFVDVTHEYLNINNTPPNISISNKIVKDGIVYMVDGHNVVSDHSNHEYKVAYWLSEKTGRRVELLPRVNYPKNIRTADYLIDGVEFDLKEVTGSGKNVIDGNLRKTKEQATNIVFDITKSPLTNEDIIKQLDDIYKAGRRGLDTVIIKRKDELVYVLTQIKK